MKTKLGRLTQAQKDRADRSVLSIQRTGDECDNTDVNLPKGLCAATRKVCRRYNAMRQYMPIQPDHSELRSYDIEVRYRRPKGRWT